MKFYHFNRAQYAYWKKKAGDDQAIADGKQLLIKIGTAYFERHFGRYYGNVDQAIPWQTDQSNNWRNGAANAVEALLQS